MKNYTCVATAMVRVTVKADTKKEAERKVRQMRKRLSNNAMDVDDSSIAVYFGEAKDWEKS